MWRLLTVLSLLESYTGTEMRMAKRNQRTGVSLLELIMVITVMGIVAAIGAARFGRSAFANFGSQGEARTVALAMQRAKRDAIKTGDNHFILFDAASPNAATQYSVLRRGGAGNTVVEGPTVLSTDVQVIPSTTEMDFNFEGEAAGPYTVSLNGNGRDWLISVIPVTGAVAVAEVNP